MEIEMTNICSKNHGKQQIRSFLMVRFLVYLNTDYRAQDRNIPSIFSFLYHFQLAMVKHFFQLWVGCILIPKWMRCSLKGMRL